MHSFLAPIPNTQAKIRILSVGNKQSNRQQTLEAVTLMPASQKQRPQAQCCWKSEQNSLQEAGRPVYTSCSWEVTCKFLLINWLAYLPVESSCPISCVKIFSLNDGNFKFVIMLELRPNKCRSPYVEMQAWIYKNWISGCFKLLS